MKKKWIDGAISLVFGLILSQASSVTAMDQDWGFSFAKGKTIGALLSNAQKILHLSQPEKDKTTPDYEAVRNAYLPLEIIEAIVPHSFGSVFIKLSLTCKTLNKALKETDKKPEAISRFYLEQDPKKLEKQLKNFIDEKQQIINLRGLFFLISRTLKADEYLFKFVDNYLWTSVRIFTPILFKKWRISKERVTDKALKKWQFSALALLAAEVLCHQEAQELRKKFKDAYQIFLTCLNSTEKAKTKTHLWLLSENTPKEFLDFPNPLLELEFSKSLAQKDNKKAGAIVEVLSAEIKLDDNLLKQLECFASEKMTEEITNQIKKYEKCLQYTRNLLEKEKNNLSSPEPTRKRQKFDILLFLKNVYLGRLAPLYQKLGYNIFNIKGRKDLAAVFLKKETALYEELRNKEGLAGCYFQEALNCQDKEKFLKAASLYQKINQKDQEAFCYVAIARLCGNNKEKIGFYLKAGPLYEAAYVEKNYRCCSTWVSDLCHAAGCYFAVALLQNPGEEQIKWLSKGCELLSTKNCKEGIIAHQFHFSDNFKESFNESEKIIKNEELLSHQLLEILKRELGGENRDE